jgi:hypothetical protein
MKKEVKFHLCGAYVKVLDKWYGYLGNIVEEKFLHGLTLTCNIIQAWLCSGLALFVWVCILWFRFG